MSIIWYLVSLCISESWYRSDHSWS